MAHLQQQDVDPYHPPLSDVIARNIQIHARPHIEAASVRTSQEWMADTMTACSGSMSFVYLHVLCFGLWVLLRTGRFGMHHYTRASFAHIS